MDQEELKINATIDEQIAVKKHAIAFIEEQLIFLRTKINKCETQQQKIKIRGLYNEQQYQLNRLKKELREMEEYEKKYN